MGVRGAQYVFSDKLQALYKPGRYQYVVRPYPFTEQFGNNCPWMLGRLAILSSPTAPDLEAAKAAEDKNPSLDLEVPEKQPTFKSYSSDWQPMYSFTVTAPEKEGQSLGLDKITLNVFLHGVKRFDYQNLSGGDFKIQTSSSASGDPVGVVEIEETPLVTQGSRQGQLQIFLKDQVFKSAEKKTYYVLIRNLEDILDQTQDHMIVEIPEDKGFRIFNSEREASLKKPYMIFHDEGSGAYYNGHQISIGSLSTRVEGQNTKAVCGNHVIEIGEECDDGNRENKDLCSSSCKVEPRSGFGVIKTG
ncbi:MAG TPA: hypothetical protein VIT68_03815 [Candidatus Gracilibacteria bacterium]